MPMRIQHPRGKTLRGAATGALIATLFTITIFALEPSQNTKFGSFSSAKKALYSLSQEETFYCGCSFQDKKVDLESCGYQIRSSKSRAERVEAEHVVPASKMCGESEAWKNGHPLCVTSSGKTYKGRECAEKAIPECDRAMNDLRNLRPAIGEINGDRSDRHFGEIPGEERLYGACDFETKERIAEPAKSLQGDIARIYLFMHAAYPSLQILSPAEVGLFKEWSRNDPVTPEECRRNEEVAQVQGAPNTIVSELCP